MKLISNPFVSNIFTVAARELFKEAISPAIQRNHKQRVEKGEVEYFANREKFPQHGVFGVAQYLGEETISVDCGNDRIVNIENGDYVLVDGNTRREWYIQNYHVPEVCKFVDTGYVTIALQKVYNEEELNSYYNSFDSKNQLKTVKHNKQSAFALGGLSGLTLEDYETTTMLNKVCSFTGKTKDNGIDIQVKLIRSFGIEYFKGFNALMDRYENATGKRLPKKYGVGGWLAAYRALIINNPMKRVDIEDLFMQIWCNDYVDDKKEALVNNSQSLLDLLGVLYCGHMGCSLRETQIALQGKNNGDKIQIQAGVIYSLITSYLKGMVYSKRICGVETAKEIFANYVKLR